MALKLKIAGAVAVAAAKAEERTPDVVVESLPDPEPSKPAKPAAKPVHPAFEMGETPPTPGWFPMKDAPKDRPICVATQIPSLKNKWAYYDVMWQEAPGDWTTAGWFVCGTQWHKLHDAMPKGWREALGHP